MKRISVILILVLSIFLSLLPIGVQALGENAAEEWEEIPAEEALPAADEDDEAEALEPELPALTQGELAVAEESEAVVEIESAEAPEIEEKVPEPPEEFLAAEIVLAEETVTAASAAAESAETPVVEDFVLVTDGAAVVSELKTDGVTEASSTDAEEVLPASGTDASTNVSTNLAKPKISSVKLTTTGVAITWGQVSGAEKYRVFRKTGSGSWKKVGDTVNTSLVDTKAKSGVKYTYTVRCVSADGKKYTSKYDATGKSITYIASPKLKSVSNGTNGVTVKWGSVTGAAKYRVFRRTENGKWKKVGDTTATSIVDKKAKSGTTYYYTVRCISQNGKSYTSAYDEAGLSILRLENPTISSAKSASKGKVTVKWKKVTGATGYIVYRRTANGKWKKIATVKSGTTVKYVDTTGKSGTQYTYTVRAYYGSTKSYYYDGKTVKVK